MYTINSTVLSYQPYFARTAAVLATVCAASVLLYGVFLLEAVSHASARQAAAQQMRAVSESLSSLEGTYLSATQALTIARAREMGFVQPSDVATVSATPTHALSLGSR